ncbi:FRG domain-containing protein [candidate division KSB1 bacterium]
MKLTEINDINDALQFIYEISQNKEFLGISKRRNFPFGFLFRGHVSTEFELIPSIFRNKNPQKVLKVHNFLLSENEIFKNAQRKFRFTARVSDRPLSNLFDWLSVLQHYEIPTRLLDWTESLAIALFFAVADYSKEKFERHDGKLIVLNARKLNSITGHEKSYSNLNTADTFGVKLRTAMVIAETREAWREQWIKSYDDNKWRNDVGRGLIENDFATPIVVLPNYLNERMFLQASIFTLHGGKLYFEEQIESIDKLSRLPKPEKLEDLNSKLIEEGNTPFLAEAIIPYKSKKTIERELNYLGFDHGTIRPELEYQSLYFKKTVQL